MNIRFTGSKALKHVIIVPSVVVLVSGLSGCSQSLTKFKSMLKQNTAGNSLKVAKAKTPSILENTDEPIVIEGPKVVESAKGKVKKRASLKSLFSRKEDNDGFDMDEYLKQRSSVGFRGALQKGSVFDRLAKQLEEVSESQSSNYHNILSLKETRSALMFDLFPEVRPVANLPVLGDSDPTFGVSVEQTILDFGQTRSNLKNATKDVERAQIEYWAERNEAIHTGLTAYLDVSRLKLRLRHYERLEKKLNKLDNLLKQRAVGGVSDRGERLRLTVVQQEVRREILNDKMLLVDSQSRLKRGLKDKPGYAPLKNLSKAQNMCVDKRIKEKTPQEILARLNVSKANINERNVRGQVLPKVKLVASAIGTSTDDYDTTVGFRLDASNMLGLGSVGSWKSARSQSVGAKRNLKSIQDDIDSSFVQLYAQRRSLLKTQAQLQELIDNNGQVLAVYRDQVDAGVVRLIDGINFYREDVNARLSLIDSQSNVIRNCLDIAQLQGSLTKLLTLEE